MLKKIAFASVLLAGSTMAMADSDIGCGLGTEIWAGNDALVPKVLGATTNGTFGNQTFGITFGTLGCKRAVNLVKSEVVEFIDHNAEALARDIAVGEGENLNVLAELLDIQAEDKNHFFNVAQANWSKLYSEENQNTTQVITTLQNMMAQDETLRKYS